jgi:zinc finger protein
LEQDVRGICPACGEEVDWTYKTENIPYFSDILIITCSCPECGYRFSDVQNISTNEPVRYIYCACCEDDLSVRVVRSSAAKITTPELGVEINPGPACRVRVKCGRGSASELTRFLMGF